MLTTVEAEVDVNGLVTLLEPLQLDRKSRAIVTVLNGEANAREGLSVQERQTAIADLMRFAGCVNSGNPRSADNEAIDADLAREYAGGR
jgi:hypothetical protein